MSLMDRITFREPGEGSEPDVHAMLTADEDGGGGQLDPDPEPGRATRRRSTTRATSTTRRKVAAVGPKTVTPAKIRDEIRTEISVYLKLAAATWGLSCEICGNTADEQVEPMAASLADMICRSPALVEKFHTTSMLADCIKFLHAAAPLAKAAMKHRAEHQTHEHGEGGGGVDYERFQPYGG
jgi:hypothetical protein